ncbi:winged helix-turn-helix transcriptional regulator [Vibrio fortis]|uniref:Winged helix-turn-helix transcriptional regulator n=1 Tax=Vibrio fortis TaxID=212667 RepID=A0A5N3QU92_9VIBR|nr:winged helix-turn-helix transcriptional regulator [Vibrio fortis]KAB0285480.1 winged helix-turn-helix transcriptional regulator [Vibrio fortis]
MSYRNVPFLAAYLFLAGVSVKFSWDYYEASGLGVISIALLVASGVAACFLENKQTFLPALTVVLATGYLSITAGASTLIKGDSIFDSSEYIAVQQRIEALDKELTTLARQGVVTAAQGIRTDRDALNERLFEIAAKPANNSTVIISYLTCASVDLAALLALMGLRRQLRKEAPTVTAEVTPVENVEVTVQQSSTKEIREVIDVDIQVMQLADAGESQRSIAKQLGISQATVSRRIKKMESNPA